MDLLRNLLTAAVILSLSSVILATPVDTAWDLVYAVESRDGQWFLDLMSESLCAQIESRIEQIKELAETNPELIEEFLHSAGLPISAYDLQWMSSSDFISTVLENINLPPLGNIVSEEASLNGRNATVIFKWSSGYSLNLQVVWEESSWKVTGSSILARIF
ncbi:MAG: hypothetical protein KAQ97_05910 [Candidatus Fermentibacteraceae bacterium]|nr:hypothetical protein [Candidatus Fermentibacteraceae bacterium]